MDCTYLTDSGKGNLITGQTERHPILRPILFTSELFVTTEATKVV